MMFIDADRIEAELFGIDEGIDVDAHTPRRPLPGRRGGSEARPKVTGAWLPPRDRAGRYGIRWKETSFMARLPRGTRGHDASTRARMLDVGQMPALIHDDETRHPAGARATVPHMPGA